MPGYASERRAEKAAPSPAPAGTMAGRPRLFIVEDEALIAMELRDSLTSLGYEVCGSASRGEDALARIPAARPDLALMDVSLAGPMDGVELAERLAPICEVPVVFLTAFSDAGLLDRAAGVNPFGYLTKPYDQRALHSTIQMALAKHRLESNLRAQAVVDPLSGLFNRRFLDETLRREVARAVRERAPLTVAMLDIDRFKQVNDTHGHAVGDQVIRSLSALLLLELRKTDFVCRFGGEEFTIIMPDTPLANALRKIESVCRRAGATSIGCGDVVLTVTLSGGLAGLPEHARDADALLAAADAALYLAKQDGRNLVRVASGDGTTPASGRSRFK